MPKHIKTMLTYKMQTLMLIVLCLFSFNLKAQELGLTPGHVYGLWNNINSATLKLASQYSNDSVWLTQLGKQKIKKHTDKTPADVLNLASVYQQNLSRLNQLRDLKVLSPIALDDEQKVTSSVVYINTGYLLDSLVGSLLVELAADDLISPYFSLEHFAGKSSSDVYSLVELANSRIDKIVRKARL
jgi:hypothetical protein